MAFNEHGGRQSVSPSVDTAAQSRVGEMDRWRRSVLADRLAAYRQDLAAWLAGKPDDQTLTVVSAGIVAYLAAVAQTSVTSALPVRP